MTWFSALEEEGKYIAQATDKLDGGRFTESLVSPKVAQTLAREAGGLRTEVLNPLEGLTDRQVSRGESYASVMRANLAKLRTALGCT